MNTNSQNLSQQAGQVQGQAQEKTDQMMGGISNTAQLVKESCQQAGEQMKAKAQDATEAVKNAIGANK